jgi:zinc/manganese transport system substrate-binding protein
VFACEPEWAALIRVLAPRARVFTATHEGQDPHEIEPRPALISALRRADLAVCTGAGLEAAWLPMLQQRAGNPRVLPGAPGLFFAADGQELLEDAHHHAERQRGHVHRSGNPHFHLDPRLYAQAAGRLADRLGRLDPPAQALYRARLATWEADWIRQTKALRERAKPLFGVAVVAEHSTFAYLFRWLDLYQTADLEPVPGMPPTLSHLRALAERAALDPPAAVIQALYQNPQSGRWLSERLGRPHLRLPSTLSADGPESSPEGWIRLLVETLIERIKPSTSISP